MAFISKRKNGTYNIGSIISFTEKLPLRKYVLYTVLFYIYYFSFISLVMEPFSKYISSRYFNFAPAWFLNRSTFLSSNPAISIVILSFSLRIIIEGLVNPFIEELFFRGYLLQKLKSLGVIGPVVNALLFSLGHLWQPFNFFTLFAMILPVYLLVWKKRSIYISIIIHCSGNLLGSLLLLIQYINS